jgi:hypothetical protein
VHAAWTTAYEGVGPIYEQTGEQGIRDEDITRHGAVARKP